MSDGKTYWPFVRSTKQSWNGLTLLFLRFHVRNEVECCHGHWSTFLFKESRVHFRGCGRYEMDFLKDVRIRSFAQ